MHHIDIITQTISSDRKVLTYDYVFIQLDDCDHDEHVRIHFNENVHIDDSNQIVKIVRL